MHAADPGGRESSGLPTGGGCSAPRDDDETSQENENQNGRLAHSNPPLQEMKSEPSSTASTIRSIGSPARRPSSVTTSAEGASTRQMSASSVGTNVDFTNRTSLPSARISAATTRALRAAADSVFRATPTG